MSEAQNIAQEITLSKQFLLNIYLHPLIAAMPGLAIDDEFYVNTWQNQPDEEKSSFGGLNGNQFESIDELVSFNEAFEKVLAKHKIQRSFKDELLYIARFYSIIADKQSSNNNEYSRLIDSTRFILDLFKNSEKHIQRFAKSKSYRIVPDPYTQEYFFAKHHLFDQYTVEEIFEGRPNKNLGDIISYKRFMIGLTEMYIPNDLMFSISGEDTVRLFDGEQVPAFNIPRYLTHELFKYTLEYMVDDHRRANTPFYNLITKEPLTSNDFKKLYKLYKRNRFSQTDALTRFGMLLSDYLTDNNIIKVKRQIAAFLFDYFSLLKIFPLKKKKELPQDYNDLPNFYNREGLTNETIRLMLKDAPKVGGI